MALLIPAFADDTTPSGEKAVFNFLAGGPDDWTVLHSLDIAPWNQSRRTEIDFLIIIPDLGIVCVEVKSHGEISFTTEGWQPPSITRSPFKQALDAKFAFVRGIRSVIPEFAIPVVQLCIFPKAHFVLSPNLSVKPCELIDGSQFMQFRTSTEFCNHVKECVAIAVDSDPVLRRPESPLSRFQVENLVRACVPVQKARADKRAEIAQRANEAEAALRQQQKPVLMLTERNDRVVVSGAAGTGKTRIAMEVARRRAERGERVALLCFNKLIGDWLTRAAHEDGQPLPNLIAGRAIHVMAEMCGISVPSNPSGDYWHTVLPQQIQERLTDPEFAAVSEFDYLVLDEAQDVLARPFLWHCLTSFLRGGEGGGKFALFGDFDHQVLGHREEMLQTLATIHDCAKGHLDENCRNYSIVGKMAVTLSGMSGEVYSGFMRSGGGIRNYDIAFYDDETAQLNQLRKWLREFKDAGFKSSEISILSMRKPEASAAAKLAPEGFALTPMLRKTGTGFTSIHAFKGLENKIIVLTDIEMHSADFQRDLFYTGMTRATDTVRVLCHTSSREMLAVWLTEVRP